MQTSTSTRRKPRYEEWKKSGISRKYPTYRNSVLVTNQSWLRGKQIDDEAEQLWRIHDVLYDFTPFVKSHPGGAFWLEQTKGTDITEAFETHHLSSLPEEILENYKVRAASNPRNYTLSLHQTGFYQTLKGRVREVVKDFDYTPRRVTHLMHLGLLASTIGFTLATAFTGSILCEITAALSLCWLAVAAHNYFHQRDNWRMYTFNLTLLNFAEWRISHALSHHGYTNSLHDLEMSLFEPFLCWIPSVHFASKLHRIVSVIVQPIVYAAIFPFNFITRLVHSLVRSNVMYWHDVIGFILPGLMLLVSEAPFLTILRQWFTVLTISSFLFGVIGLSAAHHHPKIYHDGDALRGDRDWGLYQMDTTIDRSDIKGSQFMVLTHFGEHALHHLFPTIDHGMLPQLYPVFLKTLDEFDVKLRECNHLNHIIGQSQQLLRIQPNPVPPGK